MKNTPNPKEKLRKDKYSNFEWIIQSGLIFLSFGMILALLQGNSSMPTILDIALHPRLQANYAADPYSSPIAAVDISIVEEVLLDQPQITSQSEIQGRIPTFQSQQQTPVPSITPQTTKMLVPSPTSSITNTPRVEILQPTATQDLKPTPSSSSTSTAYTPLPTATFGLILTSTPTYTPVIITNTPITPPSETPSFPTLIIPSNTIAPPTNTVIVIPTNTLSPTNTPAPATLIPTPTSTPVPVTPTVQPTATFLPPTATNPPYPPPPPSATNIPPPTPTSQPPYP